MELIPTGLQITVFGMGLVFLLLALLWGLMAVLMRLDRSAGMPAERQQAGAQQQERTDVARAPAQVAAITIAVLRHQAVCRKQAAMRAHWPGMPPDASRWVAAGRTRQNRSWKSERG